MRGRAFLNFFSDLLDGDPVAWILLSVVLAIAAVIGFFWWRGHVEQKRWEERGRKKNVGKKDR